MTPEKRAAHLDMLTYFWEAKRDLERYVCYDEAVAEFPALRQVWEQYKSAEELVGVVLRGLRV